MADDTNNLTQGLSGMMNLADPSLLISVGLGLMSGARYGSNAGEGIMQGLQMYQGMKTNQLQQQLMRQQIQTGALGLQRQQMLTNAALQAFQGDQGSQPPQAAGPAPVPPQTSQPFLPGVSPMPSGAPPAGMSVPPTAAPQGGAPGLTAPSMAQIYGTTYPGGMPANFARGMSYLSADPLAAQQKFRDDQLKLAQQSYAPTIAKLDQLIKSDAPAKYLNGTGFSDIKAAWPQLAQEVGLDPEKDYNDQNVRMALSNRRNQLASSLQEPTSEPAMPFRTIRLQDGRMAQVEPGTGKITPIASEELQQVVGAGGKPVLVPRNQAAGQQPFNASIFGVGNLTDPALENAYQNYLATGQQPTGYGRNPAMQAKIQNYFAQRMQQDGVTPGQVAATGQQFKATQGVVKDFESGQTSKTLNGLNTAIQHMAALDPVIDAMNNGNITLINKASNFFKQQTGSAAPTNFAALKEFVSGEVAKAVLPGGGGEAERKALADPINAANSPEQLKQAVQTFKTALAGKTEALRNQWDVGTGGAQGSFDKFLLPETKKALGIPSGSPSASQALAAQNAKGWTLHVDKSGNKAYVSPDGKQFEEVR